MKAATTIVVALAIATAPTTAVAQSTAAEYMSAIEGAQALPGENGLGELTVQELMDRFNVPGMSVAVIKDFEIHWAKGYGIADVETGAAVDPETIQEMLSPVGVGSFAVGFSVAKVGEGWYFSHGGSNWGFQCNLMAHKVKGYGFAIMTNADQGGAVLAELGRRIQAVYEWDSLAQPVQRGYRRSGR